MKSFRSTLILLLLAALVGGYIYYAERGPIAESGSTVLLRTDPNVVSSLRLSQAGGKTVLLQKSGESWTVQQGQTATAVPADPDTVKGLLDQVQLVQSQNVVSNESARLKEYGLDKPQSSLTVTDTKIEFGAKPKFDSSKIYARVADQVALLPATLSDAVTKPFNDWRDKAVLRVKLEETSRLALKAPAVTAALEQTKEKTETESSEWKIAQPVDAVADASTVESFINQLSAAQAAKFLEDNPKSPAKWGLDKPQAQVEITTKDGARKLLVGKRLKDGYAAQNTFSPVVFQLPEATFGLINRPLRDWRSKTVLKFEMADLTQVEVTARGTTRTYTKKDDKWKAVNATAGDADATNQAVLDLLIAAQSLSAQDFIDKSGSPSTYAFDKPGVLLKLTSARQPGPLTLQLGFPGTKAYARSGTGDNFEPTVYVLPASAKESFKSALDKLFAPPPPTPAAAPSLPSATPAANKP
ncbi:MAG: DUF4340 domain-containing protein [Armatimonadota bacterium]|nr:DUF4340 domain-containing protein [Armatimonadota bacterium]